MVIICCDCLLLADSANFIKLAFMIVKIFRWGCFAPLVCCIRGQLPPASFPLVTPLSDHSQDQLLQGKYLAFRIQNPVSDTDHWRTFKLGHNHFIRSRQSTEKISVKSVHKVVELSNRRTRSSLLHVRISEADVVSYWTKDTELGRATE